jgi:hypothetical protein
MEMKLPPANKREADQLQLEISQSQTPIFILLFLNPHLN